MGIYTLENGLIPVNGNINNRIYTSNVELIGDIDATLYINAVTNVGGNVSQIQIDAINTLYRSLKDNSIYEKITCMYPFIGGTADSHSIDGKTPNSDTYKITFTGSWVHNDLGSASNGSDCKGNTHYKFNGENKHFAFYNSDENANSWFGEVGTSLNGFYTDSNRSLGLGVDCLLGALATLDKNNDTFIASILNGIDKRLYENGIEKFARVFNDGNESNASDFYLGFLPSYEIYGKYAYGYFSFGYGLTSTEVLIYNTIINTFITSISR